MKLKLIPILTGAVVMTFAATPFFIQTLNAAQEPQLQAQATTPSRTGRWTSLNLTQAQKDQIKQIRQQTRENIKALLTPQQQEQYQDAMQKRRGEMQEQGRRQKLSAMLNLSEAQKTQIRQIKKSSKEKIKALLTEDQQKQLQQLRQSRQGRSEQEKEN